MTRPILDFDTTGSLKVMVNYKTTRHVRNRCNTVGHIQLPISKPSVRKVWHFRRRRGQLHGTTTHAFPDSTTTVPTQGTPTQRKSNVTPSCGEALLDVRPLSPQAREVARRQRHCRGDKLHVHARPRTFKHRSDSNARDKHEEITETKSTGTKDNIVSAPQW